MAALDLTVGAVEVGVLIATVVFGIVGSLVFTYVDLGFKDPLHFRLMIWSTCILEIFHTLCTWMFLYTFTVTGYGNPAALLKIPWSFAGATICTALMSLQVQTFLAHRVLILSKNYIVPMIGFLGSAFHCIFAFVIVAKFMQFGFFTFLLTHKWMVITDLAVHTGVDITLAGSMVYYLLRERSSFKATQRVVDKLILYTLETGAVTSLFSMVILTCSVTMSTNFVYLGVLVIYPKIFSIVFLVSLTSRHELRRDLNTTSMESAKISASAAQDWNNQNASTHGMESSYVSDSLQLSSPRLGEKTRRVTVPEVQITTEFEMVVSKGYESDGTTHG